MEMEGGGAMTVPVRTMLSSCSAPDPLEFQPWIEMVAEVRWVSPSDELAMLVIAELLEYEFEKS